MATVTNDQKDDMMLMGCINSSAHRFRGSQARYRSIVRPRRSVEMEPVELLPTDVMGILYEEQKQAQEEPTFSSSQVPESSRVEANAVPPSNIAGRRIQRDCLVCYEKLDVTEATTCTSCRSSFCANCTRWYIQHKILEGEVSEKKLTCPAPTCTRPLTQECIKAFVSPRLFEKFLQYRENQEPGIRFCPRPGCCQRLDEPRFSTSRRGHCTKCARDSCMKCGKEYHLLSTCRQRDRRYGKWRKRRDVRPCPNCKSDIEKQGGCAHMKCFQCDNEFCWGCLRPWATHDETMCFPLSFLKSKDPRFGCCTPMRIVTKGVVIGVVAVVAVTGIGVATVVVPPVLLYHWAKSSSSTRRRAPLRSDVFTTV